MGLNLILERGRILEHAIANPSGCLEWQRSRNRRGYGRICRYVDGKGKTFDAHRVICLAVHGEPPPGKPYALHRCDNPPCVNPDHLYWGSQPDNMRDMTSRHRHHGQKQTHCLRGHAFDAQNTYRKPNGSRACKRCAIARQRVRRERLRAAQ